MYQITSQEAFTKKSQAPPAKPGFLFVFPSYIFWSYCVRHEGFFYPACVRIVFSACRRGLQPEKSERGKGQQEGCHEEGPHTHSCFQILFKPDHTPGQEHHLQHSFPFKNSWVSCSQYRSHFETHKNLTLIIFSPPGLGGRLYSSAGIRHGGIRMTGVGGGGGGGAYSQKSSCVIDSGVATGAHSNVTATTNMSADTSAQGKST